MVVVSIDASCNTAEIDTWIMSCRVLKRNVEDLALNCIVSQLKAKGVTTLKGEYLPTAKNNMVSDLLAKFGFLELSQNLFQLDIINFTPKHTYINES
jgi:predicted enzyme involved in methoxymalonyl-ACP biosynthesis